MPLHSRDNHEGSHGPVYTWIMNFITYMETQENIMRIQLNSSNWPGLVEAAVDVIAIVEAPMVFVVAMMDVVVVLEAMMYLAGGVTKPFRGGPKCY